MSSVPTSDLSLLCQTETSPIRSGTLFSQSGVFLHRPMLQNGGSLSSKILQENTSLPYISKDSWSTLLVGWVFVFIEFEVSNSMYLWSFVYLILLKSQIQELRYFKRVVMVTKRKVGTSTFIIFGDSLLLLIKIISKYENIFIKFLFDDFCFRLIKKKPTTDSV